MAELGWHDVGKISRDPRTKMLSDQLYRALGSIGANLAEGYSRGSGRDRARFYEYALGSARESRHWYYRCRYVLDNSVVDRRLEILTQIIRLLLTQIHRRDDYAAAERAIGAREGDGPGTIWGRGGPVFVFSCRGETL